MNGNRTKDDVLKDLAECNKIAERAARVDDWIVVQDMNDWEEDLKKELSALIDQEKQQ